MIKLKIILIIFFFISCKTYEETIEITEATTDYPIILRLSQKYNKIIGIKFPKRINIENKSLRREAFIKIDYEYNSILKNELVE